MNLILSLLRKLLLISPKNITEALCHYSFYSHKKEIVTLVRGTTISLGSILINQWNLKISFRIISKIIYTYIFNLLLCLCFTNIHSKIRSSLSIKFPVGKCMEGNITRMQSSFRSIQSACVVCNFFSAIANSLSTIVNNFLGLFKSFSPFKIWNKLCSSSFFIPRVGCRMHMSP